MSDDQDRPRGGDAGTERALDELRVALEQLAARMGAGFREDLAQIRAIAASVAERDLTADVDALRADVATLVGRGADSGVAQVLARFDALEAKLDRLAGDDASSEVLARLDALTARLDSQPASQQQLLEDLQDNLADVASGEVVSALWDEVRQLRTDIPDLIVVAEPVAPVAAEPDPQLATLTDELAVLRTELAEGLVVEPSDALSASLDALKAEVDGLRDALGELRATPEPVAAPPVDDGRDEQVLEQLDALRASIDEVHARLDEGLVLADDPDASSDDGDTATVDAIAEQMAALRGFVSSEVDTVRQAVSAQLDAAAEAAEAAEPAPLVGEAPEAADLEAIADQVAALRDFVASEVDTVRQTVSARLDAAAEATAATVADIAARPEPAPAPATGAAGLDPETIDVLRDEIRASGAIADQVVDALREELKALRRRIAVKAAERVLDDQQLVQIADAVAARLAEDRDQG